MLRSIAKYTLAQAARIGALESALTGGSAAATPVVLGYHRLAEDLRAVPETALPGMVTSRATFRAQLEWLLRHYDVVPLAEWVARRFGDARAARRPAAAITFDDGYRDVYEIAYPELRRVGAPATVFVVSDWVGSRGGALHDALYRCLRLVLENRGAASASLRAYDGVRTSFAVFPRDVLEHMSASLEEEAGPTPDPYGMLGWSDLRQMARAGILAGSHTKSHALLPNESAQEVLRQLVEAKRHIEANLHEPVDHLAYPDGQFTTQVVQAARRAGYRFAYTTCDHVDAASPEMTIPRVMLWEGSTRGPSGEFAAPILRAQLRGVLRRFNTCTATHRQPVRLPVQQPVRAAEERL